MLSGDAGQAYRGAVGAEAEQAAAARRGGRSPHQQSSLRSPPPNTPSIVSKHRMYCVYLLSTGSGGVQLATASFTTLHGLPAASPPGVQLHTLQGTRVLSYYTAHEMDKTSKKTSHLAALYTVKKSVAGVTVSSQCQQHNQGNLC
jgi:hypothetical protein